MAWHGNSYVWRQHQRNGRGNGMAAWRGYGSMAVMARGVSVTSAWQWHGIGMACMA
jgi:hypothetical protein